MTVSQGRSIPDLVSDAFGQLAKLVSNEIDLAKAEMSQKAAQVGRAAAMIAAGAVIFMPALVVVLLSIAAALIDAGFTASMAYLITGGGAGLIALALIGIGINRLSGDALKPAITLDQLQRDKLAAQEIVR
jgi:hypothetical protein